MYHHGGNPLVWLASIIRRKMKTVAWQNCPLKFCTIFYGKYGMLSSCDLSSFVVMLMTKACKGQRKMKTLMDFGKRAFPQPSCTLIISRSELNPDLTEIRLHFSNFRCRSDKRCGWPWWVFGRLRWVGRRRVFGWIRRRLERWFAEKAGVGSKNERQRRGWRSRSWISWWFWRWLGRRGEILQLII